MSYLLKATSVNVARAIYALNWFDIAPGLIYISQDLKLKIVELGIATTFFYVGLATFQLIGGALASRIGARKVAFIGILVLGLGAIFSGLAQNLPELVAARFGAGLGSALFFSPGLSILRDISPPDAYSMQVGIYNGSFNLGGAVGAFGWVFVDKLVGWQFGLVIGGVLALGIAIENYIVLHDIHEEKAESEGFIKKLGDIVRIRALWILAIGTIVAMLTETVTGQFIILYAENYLRMTATQSGSVDALFLTVGFVGGIASGKILSRKIVGMQFVYFVLIISGLSFILIPFASNFAILIAISLVLGFAAVSGFSILYTLTVDFLPDRAMVPFGLSFVNFIQIAIGSLSPVIFTLIVDRMGGMYGWIVLGSAGLALISILTQMPRSSN